LFLLMMNLFLFLFLFLCTSSYMNMNRVDDVAKSVYCLSKTNKNNLSEDIRMIIKKKKEDN